jgi:hypothetical protein
LDGVNGIVGMPAMVGKVVTLDTGHWAELAGLDPFDPDFLDRFLELIPLQVQFSQSLPASNGHRYSVPIRAKTFHVMGDDPLPAESPIPFVEMTVGNGNKRATGQFILDTGASISFISTDIAIALGLDTNGDSVVNSQDEQYFDTVEIGGIGGIVGVPLFAIDSYSVTTEQGVDLVWNLEQSLSVLILDIHPDIDGVFGAELISSGWFSFVEEEEQVDPDGLGPLQQTHFDFREFFADDDLGKIYFDLTPSFDVVQPAPLPGDFNKDGIVDAADYTVWRDGMGTKYNDDDYNTWVDHFGETASGGSAAANSPGANAAVPEPSSICLLLLAIMPIGARCYRHRRDGW